MCSRSLVPAALALTVAVLGCQGEAPRLSDEDVTAIRAVVQRFPEYGLAQNWDAMVAMNTEDAVWLPPQGAAREGREAIRGFLEAFPTITEFRIAAAEVDGRGDLAVARGTYTLTTASEASPDPMTDSGKWVLILRKQADGSWLVATDIWNSDLPLPE